MLGLLFIRQIRLSADLLRGLRKPVHEAATGAERHISTEPNGRVTRSRAAAQKVLYFLTYLDGGTACRAGMLRHVAEGAPRVTLKVPASPPPPGH